MADTLENGAGYVRQFRNPKVFYDAISDFYKKAEKQTWVAEEVDLSKDKYAELNESEKLYLKNILAFFAISDGLVIDNLATNFMGEVDLLEAQYFYGHQTFIEQVHANGYSLLIESYIKDEKEKMDLFNSMETSPSVAAKASWAEKWIDHPSFVHRLIAFACVEGISFSSVFAGVFWYRSRNKMEGLASMNELIIRDLDFDLLNSVRNKWQFYRDRRPDTYGDITKP